MILSKMDLDKVLALFNGKNSEDLYERHLSAVERLCQNNAAGFAIRDLPKVQQILEITLRLLLKGVPGFLQPAVGLIKVLSKPFVKKTATDEFRLLGNISSILACIGQIFTTSGYPADLQLAASELLIVFAGGYGQRPSLLDKLPSIEQADCTASARQYHTNQMLLNSSGVLLAVVESLAAAVAVGDEVLMMSLSLVASQISYFPENANALLGAGLLDSVPQLLSFDYRHPITPVAVQLLWNLLDFAPVATRVKLVTTPAPSQQATKLSESREVDGKEAPEHCQGEGQYTTKDQGQHQREGGRQSSEEASNLGSTRPKEDGKKEEHKESQHLSRSNPTRVRPFEQTTAFGLQTRSSKPVSEKRTSLNQPLSILPGVSTSLVSLFCSALLYGFRTVDKELRNDLVVVCSLIIGSDHQELHTSLFATVNQTAKPEGLQEQAELLELCSREFINAAQDAGLFEALLAVSTSPELGITEHNGLVKAWALSTEELDYELKQLAWKVVVAGCVHAGPEERWILQGAVSSWALVRALLAYVEEVPEAAPYPALAAAAQNAQRRWSPDQMEALRAVALARLHALAPLCPEVYAEEGGPAVLLRFLSTSVHVGHIEGALRHLYSMVVPKTTIPSLGDESGMEEVLGAAGAISVLLTLLQDSSRPEGVWRYCLLLLSALCRKSNGSTVIRLRNMIGEASVRSLTSKLGSGSMVQANRNPKSGGSLLSTRNSEPTSNRQSSTIQTSHRGDVVPSASNLKRFRHEGGVGMVLSQLSRCCSADQTLPSPYTVAVLDVMWTCVVPDRKNTARFLVEDGLDALLSLIEVGNRGHRAVALSLLADLLFNPRTHQFFHAWRSHQDQSTAAHLLLRIWKEEDRAIGISDAQGVLSNTTLPLRGSGKQEPWVAPESISYGTLLPTPSAGAALEATGGSTAKGKQTGGFGATTQLGVTTAPLIGALVPMPGGGLAARLVPAGSIPPASTGADKRGSGSSGCADGSSPRGGQRTGTSSQRASEVVLDVGGSAGIDAAVLKSLESRGAKVAAMLAFSSGEPILAKVYSCFNLLGFNSFDYLPSEDGLVLTLVEKYVKFKQGEMWVSIASHFEACGMRPTAPDRDRLASGIELSEHLAAAVRDAQLAILGREADEASKKEAKFYDDMRQQRKLEQESKFYKKDRSQLTLTEIREAKEKKETMLRNSIGDFRISPMTLPDED